MAKRILVADDAQVMRDLFKALLSDYDYQVDAAENGQVAHTLLGSIGYDLLICDLNMPVMDGVKLVETLRGQGSSLPIIMVTANDYPDKKAAAHGAGIQAWFLKPFNNKDLVAKVQELIGPA